MDEVSRATNSSSEVRRRADPLWTRSLNSLSSKCKSPFCYLKVYYLVHKSQIKIAMLYIIGLGLSDEKDISVKGLEIVRKADRVYLETYTAVLLVDKERLVSVIMFSTTCSPSDN